MKTYPYTHANAVAIQQPSFLRKSLFLLFSTLITFAVFAQEHSDGAAANNAEFMLPLVLKSFDASIHSKKVNLKWVTGHEKDLSHFVIERSTNGTDYAEEAIVFASNNSGAVHNYHFAQALNTASKGTVYYRLKLMDSRGRHQYSNIRIVRLGDADATTMVQAYPNPIMNELRVTVPANWQNKQVSYEVYNLNGYMIKRITNKNASQTETLNVQELGTGTYVVKAYTKDETASQQIVKK